eukprot:EG_transcript_19125
MSRASRAAGQYSKEYKRVNPFHQLQAHAFKQFFAQPAPPGRRGPQAVKYPRHQVDAMFFRVNSLLLALHRHHLPLMVWVKPDDSSKTQKLLHNYALVLSQSNLSITTLGPKAGYGFATNHRAVYQRPAEVLWLNADPQAYGGGKLIPTRTKWFIAFVRILYTLHQLNTDKVLPADHARLPPVLKNRRQLGLFVKAFLNMHTYALPPNSFPGAMFYVGTKFEKDIDPHFLKEVRCMGTPLITVGTSAESYKLPGSPENTYLMLFYLYYFDRLTKKFQADEYVPTTARWRHIAPQASLS